MCMCMCVFVIRSGQFLFFLCSGLFASLVPAGFLRVGRVFRIGRFKRLGRCERRTRWPRLGRCERRTRWKRRGRCLGGWSPAMVTGLFTDRKQGCTSVFFHCAGTLTFLFPIFALLLAVLTLYFDSSGDGVRRARLRTHRRNCITFAFDKAVTYTFYFFLPTSALLVAALIFHFDFFVGVRTGY